MESSTTSCFVVLNASSDNVQGTFFSSELRSCCGPDYFCFPQLCLDSDLSRIIKQFCASLQKNCLAYVTDDDFDLTKQTIP